MNQNTAYFSFYRRFLMVLIAASIATGCASATYRVDPKNTLIKACVNTWFRERGPMRNAEMAYNAYTQAEKVCRQQVIKYYNKK